MSTTITHEVMEAAKARCLELVNDGKCHADYDPIFRTLLERYGAEKVHAVAASAVRGDWNPFVRLDGRLADAFSALRSRHGFTSNRPSSYTGYATMYARVVSGLVLQHWLSSNAPAPIIVSSSDPVVPTAVITKENAVMLKIETKTFINGAEIKNLTIEQLVSLISDTEAQIKKLEDLNSKPKKVLAKIDELKSGLAKLVELADAE